MAGRDGTKLDAALWSQEFPPRGGESVRIGFGPMVVALSGLSGPDAAALHPRYRSFLPGAQEPVTLDIRVGAAGTSRFLPMAPGENHRVEVAEEEGTTRVWSYGFAGDLCPSQGAGRLFLCDGGAPELLLSVENFLRVAVSRLALHRGGALLHAAGVLLSGEVRILLGPEGSGKSSLAAAAPPGGGVLSDDLVLLLPDGAGYAASGVPFHGDFQSASCRDPGHPVAGLWRLERGKETGKPP